MTVNLGTSTPGLNLLNTSYQNQVQQGLIPDLFSRFVPTQQQPQQGAGFGAMGGSFGPAPAQPPPTVGSSGGQGGQQGAGGAGQLAQAALLLQLLQGGSQGFLGRLMPGQGMGQQMQGLQGMGQGGFGLLTDPSVQALFNPQNLWKPNTMTGLQRGYPAQSYGGMGQRPGLAPTPDVFQQAITALQMILGIGQPQQNA
jgi:hypothetical protein